MFQIILASGNSAKCREFAHFFKSCGAFAKDRIELVSYHDINCGSGGEPQVDETGESYEENALLKARSWASFYGMPAIADDSGLEARALSWGPGIYSARAAAGSDEERVSWLLHKLEGVRDRRARFSVCIAIAFPSGAEARATGRDYFAIHARCWGNISLAPAGDGGFGYDPVFVPDGYDKTFAELGGEAKSKISHRAIGMRGVAEIVPSMLKYYAVHGVKNRF